MTAELDLADRIHDRIPQANRRSTAVPFAVTVGGDSNAAGNSPRLACRSNHNQPPGERRPQSRAAQRWLPADRRESLSAVGGKRESIINYEVDKTIRVVKGASGLVKRINAAVVVNHNVTINDKGKTISTPLTEAQIEKMTALVRESVGFNKDRGDSVNLLNAAFVDEKVAVVDVPFYRQPEVVDLARSFAWPLGTLLFAALVLVGVIRPAIKAMGTAPVAGATVGNAGPMNQLDALESDMPERPQLGGPGTAVDTAQITASEKQLERCPAADARQHLPPWPISSWRDERRCTGY